MELDASDDRIAPQTAATRRKVLGTVGTLAAAGALPLAAPFIGKAWAADGPIRIGMLLAKTGVFTIQGEHLSDGVKFALEQVGSRAMGRPVELIWYDDASPQDAQQNMEKLIEKDKVCGVVGGSNSASAAAVSAVAKRAKMPFVVVNATAADFTGTKCNRYTFRVPATIDVTCRGVASVAQKMAKRWYFLYPPYAYGQEVYATLKRLLVAAGGTEVAVDVVPLGTTDFSSLLLKIRDAKPEGVCNAMAGADMINFYKQYAEIGLKSKIPIVAGATEDSLIWSMGTDALAGVFGKIWHFSDPQNTSEEKAFVQLVTRSKNRPPSYNNYSGWLAMRLLLASIEQAKSIEAPAIVQALETVRFGDRNPVYFRPWDHQLMTRVLCIRAKPVITDKWDWVDVVGQLPAQGQSMDELYGYQKDSLCKMDSI